MGGAEVVVRFMGSALVGDLITAAGRPVPHVCHTSPMTWRLPMRLSISRHRLVALLVCIGAVLGLALLNPGAAQASHTRYTDLYVSTAGVPYESVLFGNHAGGSFYLSPGTSDCCYIQPDAYVPAGRDLLFFSRERPGWSYRAANTGWQGVPRLDSPQHIIVRQVDH